DHDPGHARSGGGDEGRSAHRRDARRRRRERFADGRERMKPLDAVRMAWRNLLEGRVFFVANVIAIAVGVFLVAIMLSLANGIRAYAEQLLQRDVGANTIEVSFDRRASAAPLTAERLRALTAVPGVGTVTPVVQG